jgi:hypothetical protein
VHSERSPYVDTEGLCIIYETANEANAAARKRSVRETKNNKKGPAMTQDIWPDRKKGTEKHQEER